VRDVTVFRFACSRDIATFGFIHPRQPNHTGRSGTACRGKPDKTEISGITDAGAARVPWSRNFRVRAERGSSSKNKVSLIMV